MKVMRSANRGRERSLDAASPYPLEGATPATRAVNIDDYAFSRRNKSATEAQQVCLADGV